MYSMGMDPDARANIRVRVATAPTGQIGRRLFARRQYGFDFFLLNIFHIRHTGRGRGLGLGLLVNGEVKAGLFGQSARRQLDRRRRPHRHKVNARHRVVTRSHRRLVHILQLIGARVSYQYGTSGCRMHFFLLSLGLCVVALFFCVACARRFCLCRVEMLLLLLLLMLKMLMMLCSMVACWLCTCCLCDQFGDQCEYLSCWQSGEQSEEQSRARCLFALFGIGWLCCDDDW
ncbi:hypothetical protein BpHYR1_050399 [Brachionus plicatilis]|uniref:Uncharacterized protein n=1 Tax=Brachionus plicatilis TaxID=10195 RepID=A0A3M7SC07_BRAPC|nr:hypothetical protein BpHYR1_050399 [Brachionus plicatilis]